MRHSIRPFLVAAALAAGLTLPLTPPAAAQRAGAEVAMPLQLEAGQQFTVTITDVVTTRGAPAARDTDAHTSFDLTMDQTSTIVFGLEVQGADRWRWTIADMRFDMAELGLPEKYQVPEAQAALGAGLRLATDLGFECRVDGNGRCLELTNWPAWEQRLNTLGTLMSAGVVLGSVDDGPEQRAQMRQLAPRLERFVRAALDGIDPAVAASSFSQVYPLAALSGRRLTLGQPTPFTEEWAMPFDAPPVRVSGTLTLTSVDRANQTAVVERTARGDAESLRGALVGLANGVMSPAVQMFGDMTPEAAPQIQMAAGVVQGFFQGSSLTFEETSRGTIDLRTGFARDVATTYTIAFKHPMLASQGFDTDGVVVTTQSRLIVTPGAPPAMPGLSMPPATPPSTPIR